MATSLTYHDKIAVIDLGDDENRFAPEFIEAMNGHLATAVSDGAQALVTTASGKFYSNGLDLEWLMANADRTQWYVDQVHALFARVLALPIPTAAALPGHAFGAGAMLAMAHDYRVMRADRGFFCFPEVDIHIPFTTGMAALIQAKLTPQAAIASMTTGRRFGGTDALAAGIVDATAVEGAVKNDAIGMVAPLGIKDQATLGAIKQTMFADAIAALTKKSEAEDV
ncbi:enoyl-CoA hydratase-related protein [Hoyosella altamirensis]|uniref:Enoyl-CoA hydratase/carnithine racemase n=1 Tax=Hoyosella altamirensis TaxID=616997 RepID=A0A839RMK0_9ACTN|nr:enoyl-CoA hydratase-related protein [Hoyosella altamirensis]MBB3037161.1 enoyl-CoA hydratase/carnithine racemase [Hoyosella altamirensis]